MFVSDIYNDYLDTVEIAGIEHKGLLHVIHKMKLQLRYWYMQCAMSRYG